MKRKIVFGLLLGLGAVLTAVVLLEKNNHHTPTKQVNPDAPAQTRQTMRIDAPPKKVWQLLSQINEWSSWQLDIEAPHFNGPFRAGTSFDWQSGGLLFIPRCTPVTLVCVALDNYAADRTDYLLSNGKWQRTASS